MIDAAKAAADVSPLYHQHYHLVESPLTGRNDLDEVDMRLRHQNYNPAKILTSGPEERTDTAIFRVDGVEMSVAFSGGTNTEIAHLASSVITRFRSMRHMESVEPCASIMESVSVGVNGAARVLRESSGRPSSHH
jgi:hypothetical protein